MNNIKKKIGTRIPIYLSCTDFPTGTASSILNDDRLATKMTAAAKDFFFLKKSHFFSDLADWLTISRLLS